MKSLFPFIIIRTKIPAFFLSPLKQWVRWGRTPVLLLLALLALAGCQAKPDAYTTQQQAVYFSHYRGKWLIINYWASWCKPCWQEVPVLNAFSQRYAQQVVVLGVNYERVSPQQLSVLIDKMQIHFPVLTSDPAAHWSLAPMEHLPSTVIINPQGQWVTTAAGPQTFIDLQKITGLS